MRLLPFVVLAVALSAGCDSGKPVATQPAPGQPVLVEPAQPADVEIGGPQGGVHVVNPDAGTRVDVDASGVHVKTPESKVDVP